MAGWKLLIGTLLVCSLVPTACGSGDDVVKPDWGVLSDNVEYGADGCACSKSALIPAGSLRAFPEYQYTVPLVLVAAYEVRGGRTVAIGKEFCVFYRSPPPGEVSTVRGEPMLYYAFYNVSTGVSFNADGGYYPNAILRLRTVGAEKAWRYAMSFVSEIADRSGYYWIFGAESPPERHEVILVINQVYWPNWAAVFGGIPSLSGKYVFEVNP